MRSVIYLIAAVLALVFFTYQGYQIILRFTPPLSYIGLASEKPEYKSGEPLIFIYTLYRRRNCQSEIRRFIVNDSGLIVWRSSIVAGANPKIGEVFSVRDPLGTIDPPLSAGNYLLNSAVYLSCPEGDHVVQAPLARFKVVQ